MDKRERGMGNNAEKVKDDTWAEHDVDRGANNSDKVQGHQKEVRFWKSDEPAKMTTQFFPTCHVILFRCDGLLSSVSSLEAVKGNGNHGQSGDSTEGKGLETSDKTESGLTNREIRETDSRRPSSKPTLGPTNPTQVGTKKHICHLCSKSFGHLCSLNRHVRSHMGERPHQCQICSKSFELLETLNKHIRSHTCELPYKCHLCSKSFAQKGNLTVHHLIHTGEQPHQCHICSKSFQTRGNLKMHIKIHTGELPHKCNYCSKAFVQKEQLKKHIQSHTGEQPHNCELCTKSFGQKVDLNRHIRAHTGELPYQCQICSKSFGHVSHLYRHVRTQHITTGRK